jgi:hypothetical protein
MPMVTLYGDRKAAILKVLTAKARQRDRITYGELGSEVGIPPNGPWKKVLDEIADDETAAGRPDITVLVVRKSSGLPGQIDGRPAVPATPEQVVLAVKTTEAVWSYYSREAASGT